MRYSHYLPEISTDTGQPFLWQQLFVPKGVGSRLAQANHMGVRAFHQKLGGTPFVVKEP